jgi:glycosyltransferase involved in cell wall biosynthesis
VRAGDLGLATYYELPTAYFAQKQVWLEQEVCREPELRPYFAALNESKAKLERKARELSMADVVICPSTFVQRSVEGRVNSNSILHVIPYGSDPTVRPKIWNRTDCRRPLRLIYAGPLSPHKGLHHLFQALASLPFYSYVLTLAGRWVPGYHAWLSRRYAVHYEYVGQLRSCELDEMYRANHVLVFPSLCDGFGLVLLEAMAAGIPVIATERTGAPDIVSHGRQGYLVRAGYPEDLVRALERCLNDPETLAEMGQRARRKAEELSWTTYRRRLVEAVCGHRPSAQSAIETTHAAAM